MKETNIIKVKDWSEIPENLTGLAEFPNGTKHWYKEGNRHREDGPAIEREDGSKFWYKEGKFHRENGPACEWSNGTKSWFLNGKNYSQINLDDHIVLDQHQGPCNITWYKLLDKDKIIEYPDIPGLIEK